MKAHKLKVTCSLTDTGGGTFRFDFRVSPLVVNSPVFTFMRYCLAEDIDKKNKENARSFIAYDLREKHRKCWERYHMWMESQ